MHPNHLIERGFFFKGLIVLGCLILGGIACKFAIADFYYDRAKNLYSSVDVRQSRNADVFLPFLEDLDRALDWRGTHVDALDLKADILYQSWWLSPDAQYFEQSLILQDAARIHKLGLTIRKNWSYSTARLALIYSHEKKLGKEFDRWFVASFQQGLYETDLARLLMGVGLENWKRLSTRQRSITIEFAIVSIEQKANSLRNIRKLLIAHKQLDSVCKETGKTVRSRSVCAGN